jgi:hypothetical protein
MLQVSIYGNITHANKMSYNGGCVCSLEEWIQHLSGDYLIQQPWLNYPPMCANPTTYRWHPNSKIIYLIFMQFKSLQHVKIIECQKKLRQGHQLFKICTYNSYSIIWKINNKKNWLSDWHLEITKVSQVRVQVSLNRNLIPTRCHLLKWSIFPK